ncbi:MAG TPA: phosphoglycerate mutase, partial [Sutterellaceae bacterium]|nr:phosphoglycerate mutase [Sutterellaceae bacterium]
YEPIRHLQIKNTKPILYEFDKDMNVIGRKVLEPTTENKE